MLTYANAVVPTTVGTAKADMPAHHALAERGERRVESAKMVRLTSTGLLPFFSGCLFRSAHTRGCDVFRKAATTGGECGEIGGSHGFRDECSVGGSLVKDL